MVIEIKEEELAIDCFLLAGRLLMQSGAETYRAEDTMLRMANSQGLTSAQSFVTPTGIIFSAGHQRPTRIIQIPRRSTDLAKIALVNGVSRRLATEQITLEEAYEELQRLDRANLLFPTWVQIVAAAIASGCFLILFEGMWKDVAAAILAGGVGFLIFVLMHELTKVKFFAEFTASLFVGITAFLAVRFGIGIQIDKIIIASVMPLVPGLLIANAVRDLMAGHFVSGVAKGMEAFLTAFAIGAGIALVLSF
ncbi:threonine/serine exporter family protein [Viridibacillus sp. YIM B01967]|uniref:Threonine/serine exporter family protein n=1 Tax=Viridibacillus soli TaxID=2798301 RepID=A0ABS1H7W3_9BACL|nr:threonine/serine exporter family protein [Viridibacillus soli]MBK3495504.1 threonine/serine exporter family protein [Viridibacillus soli]